MQAPEVLADVAAAYFFSAQTGIDPAATIARLNHRGLHDALSGLPNRTLFEELLDRAVARARRSHRIAAVLFADIDGERSLGWGWFASSRYVVAA